MLEIFNTFLTWLPYVFIYYAVLIPTKTYKAYKDFKPNPNVSVKLPPSLKTIINEKDFNKLKLPNVNRYFTKFSKTIEEKMPIENLILYLRNKKDLKINESTVKMILHSFTFKGISAGFYSMKNNSINLYSNNLHEKELLKNTPYHEFFHMASTYYTKESQYSGFMQINMKNTISADIIGISLNEGYTQTLAERYFNDGKEAPQSLLYSFSRNISKMLEKIVGEKKMENLYMNANLKGLLNELSLYNDNDKNLLLLQNMDYVFKHYSSIPAVRKKCLEKIKEIQLYLINSYIEKKEKELKEGIINIQSFGNDIIKYIYEIQVALYIDDNNLNQINIDEVLTYLKNKVTQSVTINNFNI